MSSNKKNQRAILEKLRIEELNPMQKAAQQAIHSHAEIVLLSPTGTGKTLAFLLPLIAELDPENPEIQALILVPSRELAIQIEQVARDMGTGYKINAIYGGQTSFSKDKINLKHRPAILIGTPGRVADHIRRSTFPTDQIRTLVLDEYDKSLEIGFEKEMDEIVLGLPEIKKKILTSATEEADIPPFIEVDDPHVVNFLADQNNKLDIKLIVSPEKDKLETLVSAICHLGNAPGIIFCNYKDSIRRISDFLTSNQIAHGCFYGGMEQMDRERALIQFRNGTHQLLLATDLAARGIDIPEIKFIIHYHLPHRSQEFTHRNGRTARMFNDGTAYVLKWQKEQLPDFITTQEIENLADAPVPSPSNWKTVFISGGRKDKISKGDIAGLFLKQGQLSKEDVGIIEVKQDCAFVAIQADKTTDLIKKVDNTRLKKKKVRVSVV